MYFKTLIRFIAVVYFVEFGKAGPAEDASKTTPEILTTYGYPNERHFVTTDDSYLLTLTRVPRGKNDIEARNRDVVLITHGLLGSDIDFILLGPKNALVYILADAGYDVWMMNCRGIHMKYKVDDHAPNFWNFSMHELGVYDLPNTIDYILNITGRKQLIHIGHSQGAAIFYIMLSERPEYNQKVKVHFSYAPGVYICYTTNPMLKRMAKPELNGTINRNMGGFNVSPAIKLMTSVLNMCKDSPDDFELCSELFDKVANFGSNETQFDKKLLPMMLAHYPANVAAKQMVHYSQFVNDCNFAKYREYPTDQIELYNLSNVQVPIYCFYGDNDCTVAPESIGFLENGLPHPFIKRITLKRFGHMDFINGIGARQFLNEETLNILNTLI